MPTYKSKNGIYSFEYIRKGEFRMGADGYSLVVNKQNSKYITYFEDKWAFVGQLTDEVSPVKESKDGRYAVINDNHDNIFIIDLEEAQISLYRTNTRFNNNVCNENAIWGNDTTHVRGKDFFYYIQFPFLEASEFERIFNEYQAIRSSQLMNLIKA